MRDPHFLPVERRAIFQGILTKRRMPPHVVDALRPPPKPTAQARQHELNWDERLKLVQHQAHKRLQAARAAGHDALDDLVAQQAERNRRVPAIANRLYSNEQPAPRQPAPPMLHPLQAFAQWHVQPAPVDARRWRSCGLRTMTRRPWPLVRDLGAYHRRPSRQRWTRRLRGLRLSMWWWQQIRVQQPSSTPPDGDTIGVARVSLCTSESVHELRSDCQQAHPLSWRR